MNKNISSIQYNSLNLPSSITYQNGNMTGYAYNSAGVKLTTSHTTGGVTATTQYCGSAIYDDGALSQLLINGGYITFSGTTPAYHFYLQDHLGSNRVVVSQGGTVEQVNHYYPFGGIIADISSEQNVQPYKYNGKELDRMHGLDTYDYGARQYNPITAHWDRVDPLCEEYYSMSPYNYCGNNPISFVDPDGCDYWSTSDKDQIIAFLNAVGSGATQFDFSGWNHATDAEILGSLVYNDEKKKFYASYGRVVDGEVTIYSKSFDANLTPVSYSGIGYLGAYVYEPLDGFLLLANHYLNNGTTYSNGIINWQVNSSGRITGVAPIIGIADFGGSFSKTGGIAKLISKGAKRVKGFGVSHGQKVYKLGNKYYSWDIDKHNGGELKVFERKGGKLVRIGTADENLNI